jgi:hypothetical protein
MAHRLLGLNQTTLRSTLRERTEMSKILRGLAAGWGAKKLGGGCFTTILVFILLWWLLGNFSIFQ